MEKSTNDGLFVSVQQFITKHSLITNKSTIVVGLSGGPDSVFLLQVLLFLQKKMDLTLICAHLDHEWRKNSAQDTHFCHEVADNSGSAFVSSKMSELDKTFKSNGSKEKQGRDARRYFLEHVQNRYHADAIALGHHAQDQQETFFIRLIRGTSLSGITAMQPKEGYYVRPLLEVNKEAILSYLDHKTIPYLNDPTNDSNTFLRNRIRQTVLPALRTCDKRFDANFLASLTHLQETDQFLDHYTRAVFDDISRQHDGKTWINISSVLALQPTIKHRIILHLLRKESVLFTPTHTFFAEIERFFCNNKSNSHSLHPSWKIIKKGNNACIESHKT